MVRVLFSIMSLILFLSACQSAEQPGKSRNVILFIGDGTGIPTLNAASILEHGEPLELYLYKMPHVGLMETSASDTWVTDSAAGMTAIMTGEKTNNGVVSQGKDAVRGSKDGRILKTLLEFAEERGLSTGVVSNSPMADATPAACYAHSNSRDKTGEIFSQILKPRFGDGVDVVVGPGRQAIVGSIQEMGIDIESAVVEAGYVFASDQEAMVEASLNSNRLIALYGGEPYELSVSVEKAIDVLSRNPKGFFLMVESNNHSRDVEGTLRNAIEMDRIVEATSKRMSGGDTLIICTADHSYDLRLPGGPRTKEILERVVINDSHTSEEVLVTAEGPGAEGVSGVLKNTDLFKVMMDAYGW